MLQPTAEEISALRDKARKSFSSDRLVGVVVTDPVSGKSLVKLVIAPPNFDACSTYLDQRASAGVVVARSTLFEERLLWPTADALAPIRAEWPAFDALAETALRQLLGFFDDGESVAVPLTSAVRPPGLDVDRAKQLLSDGACGGRLWAVWCVTNGLSCVLRQPEAGLWSMSAQMLADSVKNHRGLICPILDIVSDHCAWEPTGRGLRSHVEERPGRASDLMGPWTTMGGAAATASASFL